MGLWKSGVEVEYYEAPLKTYIVTTRDESYVCLSNREGRVGGTYLSTLISIPVRDVRLPFLDLVRYLVP